MFKTLQGSLLRIARVQRFVRVKVNLRRLVSRSFVWYPCPLRLTGFLGMKEAM